MTSPDQTAGFRSTVPMLSAIGLTALAFAGLIAWQVSGVPIIAVLLVPWLALMVCLALTAAAPPTRPAAGAVRRRDMQPRQRVAVAGLAAGAIVAAVTVSGGWAAISPDPTSGQNASGTPALAAAESARTTDGATGVGIDGPGRDR